MNKNIRYACLSAIILWMAWPPLPFASPLLLFGLVPLLIAIDRIYHSKEGKKGKKVFWISALTFFIWNTGCIYWIWNASAPGAIVAYVLGALLMTLSVYCYFRVKSLGKPVIADLSFISFWITYEYLHQTWDLNFPWMNLGNGFASTTHLIQWYEYTGVYGGTLWVLGSNILLLNIWRHFQRPENRRRFPARLVVAFACWILIPIGVSLGIYLTYDEEGVPANIVVVQPNVDPYAKYEISLRDNFDRLIKLSRDSMQQNTEFIIWPETAIPEFVDESRFGGSHIHEMAQKVLEGHANTTLLTGAETFLIYPDAKTPSAKYSKENGSYWDSFNTAVTIESSPRVQFYHKSKLVPGVEKMPFSGAMSFLKPLFSKFGGTTGGYGYQTAPSVLYSQNGAGVAPVICYESIWGNWVSGYVQQGAQFIAVITNDGWWGNTSGKNQHLEYARLRAIETRRWVARSANTGISAFINQRGDVVQKTEWWKPAVLEQDILLSSNLTFYTKHPDIIAYPFILLGTCGFIFLVFGVFFNNKKKAEN